MFDVGQNILQERLRQGITQAKLTQLTGIAQPNLSAIEKGNRDISVSMLRRISLALNVRPSRLLGEETGDTQRSVELTRPRIERIARLTISAAPLGQSEEERLARLFQLILPTRGAKRKPAKQTVRSWLELRALLDQNQIRSVLGRIRDAQQRAA